MTEVERAKIIVIGTVLGVVAFVALVVGVFATGQTFAQRCAKYFPDDFAAQERCVTNLNNGLNVQR